MTEFDLAVIGAGPAGMAAASEASKAGLSVVLLDEQSRLGGQIYRNIERSSDEVAQILGKDYLAGQTLATEVARSEVCYMPKATVWQADPAGEISYSVGHVASRISAKRILIATGAIERPCPIPGWTKPGVMMAGAGQILLKQSGVVAQKAVLAGSGPLLYLIAAQMIRAGTPPLAVVETQTATDLIKAQRHVIGALRGWRYLVKGLGLFNEIKRAGVKRYSGARMLQIQGEENARVLAFLHNGQKNRIECDTIYLHMGVVPNTQLCRSMNLDHVWDDAQHCFKPVSDAWGQSSDERVFIAGDGGGIGGALVAEISGRLAALKVAHDLGKIQGGDFSLKSRVLRQKMRKELAIRPFLDAAYPPASETIVPADDTIVCRCEEVTAGDIRKYASMGCDGPNQTKAFGRSGMGPCQGRYCGLTVASLLAEANGRSMRETGYYRIRAPIKPITLGELAQLDETGGGGKEGMDLG